MFKINIETFILQSIWDIKTTYIKAQVTRNLYEGLKFCKWAISLEQVKNEK